METLPTFEFVGGAIAPFMELFGLAGAALLLSGLAAYAGWLMNENARRDAAATGMFGRLHWWRGYIEGGWGQRLDRLEDLLSGDEATQLQRP